MTDIGGILEVGQHVADLPEDALREHIGRLPYDDGWEDDDVQYYLAISEGRERVQLSQVTPEIKNTWVWAGGARRTPPIVTYLVKTDIAD